MNKSFDEAFLLKEYRAMFERHPGLAYEAKTLSSEVHPSLCLVLAEQLSKFSSITRVPKDISHRPLLGPVIVFAKKTLRIFFRPFLKILLSNQDSFNQLVVDQALQLAQLERRMSILEGELLDSRKVQGDSCCE